MNNQELWENFFNSVLHYIKVTRGSLPSNAEISQNIELVAGTYPQNPDDDPGLTIRIWTLPDAKPEIATLKSYTVDAVKSTYKEFKRDELDANRTPQLGTESKFLIGVIREVAAELGMNATRMNAIMTKVWTREMASEMTQRDLFKQVP